MNRGRSFFSAIGSFHLSAKSSAHEMTFHLRFLLLFSSPPEASHSTQASFSLVETAAVDFFALSPMLSFELSCAFWGITQRKFLISCFRHYTTQFGTPPVCRLHAQALATLCCARPAALFCSRLRPAPHLFSSPPLSSSQRFRTGRVPNELSHAKRPPVPAAPAAVVNAG